MEKLIALVLVLVCVLGLIGCFNSNNDNHGVAENVKANLSEIAIEEPLDMETGSGVVLKSVR